MMCRNSRESRYVLSCGRACLVVSEFWLGTLWFGKLTCQDGGSGAEELVLIGGLYTKSARHQSNSTWPASVMW